MYLTQYNKGREKMQPIPLSCRAVLLRSTKNIPGWYCMENDFDVIITARENKASDKENEIEELGK